MNLTRRLPPLVIGCLLMTACGQNTSDGAAAPEMLRGTVRLTGSEPAVMVTLSRAGHPDMVLTGEWRSELRQLDGAEVTVDGVREGDSPMAGFAVTSYRIESIGGQRPVVGVLAQRNDRFWVDGEETVPLAVVPTGLRRALGAKVWVVGTLENGAITPSSYGILRSP